MLHLVEHRVTSSGASVPLQIRTGVSLFSHLQHRRARIPFRSDGLFLESGLLVSINGVGVKRNWPERISGQAEVDRRRGRQSRLARSVCSGYSVCTALLGDGERQFASSRDLHIVFLVGNKDARVIAGDPAMQIYT
jgi:hypothetical protein